MKNKIKNISNTLTLIFVIIAIIIALIFFIMTKISTNKIKQENKNDQKNITDAVKFKNQYEDLNDSYIEMEIKENNVINYTTLDEIKNIMKNGTGVILISNTKDNLSRQIIPVLFQASENIELKNIYYHELSNKTNYDLIINLLQTDIITVNNITSPTVIFVSAGEIIGVYSKENTVLDTEGLLTYEQRKELHKTFLNYLEQFAYN